MGLEFFLPWVFHKMKPVLTHSIGCFGLEAVIGVDSLVRESEIESNYG